MAVIDGIDWDNIPFPPSGEYIPSDHVMYQAIFNKDTVIGNAPFPIVTIPGVSRDASSKNGQGSPEEKEAAYSAFFTLNPLVIQALVMAASQTWIKVMGQFGRAVGPLDLASDRVIPWNPSMGPWNPSQGPYDYLHPLNAGLPAWNPIMAYGFHMVKAMHPEYAPNYPTNTNPGFIPKVIADLFANHKKFFETSTTSSDST